MKTNFYSIGRQSTGRGVYSALSTINFNFLILLAFLTLAIPFRVSAASTNGISIAGKSSYQVTGNTVVIKVDKISNTRAAGLTSGTLKLTLWAFSTPFNGVQASGYELATYRLGELPAGSSYNTVSSGSIAYTAPPTGTWHYTLFVDEFQSADQWLWDDYVNFDNASTPSNNFTYTGQILDQNNTPLADAKVSFVANKQNYSSTTDSNGNFTLSFDKTNIPSTIAFWATKPGYVPFAGNLTIKNNAADVGKVTLEPLNDKTVVIEIEPDVHHLGDDQFGGSINSQFQKTSEGLIYQRTFAVTAEQKNSTGATITFLAKGVDSVQSCLNKLIMNGTQISTLKGSPSDGGFGTQQFTISMSNLISGANTLSVVSNNGNGCGTYDDFEFTNVVLKFSGTPASTGTNDVSTDKCVFFFAEANYPGLFPGVPSENTYQQYHYRYYPASNTYLAIDTAKAIYLQNAATGGVIQKVGTIKDFQAQISAWDAKQPISCSANTSNPTPSKQNQSISFGAPPTLAVGGVATVFASANSGLAISYSTLTSSICTISGSKVTALQAGTCVIAANQSGNGTYSAASQVTQSITVAAATASSGIAAYVGTYSGTYSGTDQGNISATITADGRISGNGSSSLENYSFSISGQINANGLVSLTGTGTAGTSNFSGSFSGGTISGTWSDSASSDKGSFSVKR